MADKKNDRTASVTGVAAIGGAGEVSLETTNPAQTLPNENPPKPTEHELRLKAFRQILLRI